MELMQASTQWATRPDDQRFVIRFQDERIALERQAGLILDMAD